MRRRSYVHKQSVTSLKLSEPLASPKGTQTLSPKGLHSVHVRSPSGKANTFGGGHVLQTALEEKSPHFESSLQLPYKALCFAKEPYVKAMYKRTRHARLDKTLHDVRDIIFKEHLLFQYIKIKKPLSKLEKQGQQVVLK